MHIQICVYMCMCPRSVRSVCVWVRIVWVSSKGNTIYMKLHKNGCWNNKILQNKNSNFQVFGKSTKQNKKRKMIISQTESNTSTIMHTFYKT